MEARAPVKFVVTKRVNLDGVAYLTLDAGELVLPRGAPSEWRVGSQLDIRVGTGSGVPVKVSKRRRKDMRWGVEFAQGGHLILSDPLVSPPADWQEGANLVVQGPNVARDLLDRLRGVAGVPERTIDTREPPWRPQLTDADVLETLEL